MYATSWGVSTRLIGAVIMTHGDDKGLRLPPKIAPYQVVIVPISRTDEDRHRIRQFIEPILNEFNEKKIRVHQDWSPNSPGFKFNEWEMKGVPLRLEVGPRDVEENQVMLVRRDTGNKIPLPRAMVATKIDALLDEIQDNLFQQALKFREENTFTVKSFDEFKSIIENNGGFIRCGWDGDTKTELEIKEKTMATIRCILPDGDTSGKTCVYSGNPAKYEVVFAKAY